MDELSKELQDFFEKYPVLEYKKGQTIFRADETPQGVYIIKKGYTRAYKISEKGEELTLMTFKQNEIFPISLAINNRWNEYFCESITDTSLWRVPHEDFITFIKNKPDILFEITQTILARLGGLLLRMEHLNLGTSNSRVASIIKIYSERFGRVKDEKITIDVPLSHRDISTLIGLTRETVSISMHHFKEKKIIDYKGKIITVLDEKKLNHESHPSI